MKRWMILLTGLTLVGCGTTRTGPTLPDWTMAEREHVEAADPAPLPVLCTIPWPSDSVECWSRLDAYDVVANGNTEIAIANTSALRKTEAAYDSLVEAGKLQQQLSHIRQELLEEERRAHTLDNWYHRGLLVLFGAALVL